MSMQRVTVVMRREFQDILRSRAEINNRSVSKEILFLIETALAMKSETTREMIHFMYKAQADSNPLGDEAS